MPLYYNKFAFTSSLNWKCPLCGTSVEAGVHHECSNPKPDGSDEHALPDARKKMPAQKRRKAETQKGGNAESRKHRKATR